MPDAANVVSGTKCLPHSRPLVSVSAGNTPVPVGACGRALRARVGVAGMRRGAWRTAGVMEEAGGAAGPAVGRVCACVGVRVSVCVCVCVM